MPEISRRTGKRKKRPVTFEAYLGRFRLLQYALEKDERSLKWIRGDSYRAFLRRFGRSQDAVLSSVVITEETLVRRIQKRQRLCERYASRLVRAIARIPAPELREYALLHYLYGLTHEDIADQSFFSVRTVYRHGNKAKTALKEALLKVGPRCRPISPGKFYVKGILPRRVYDLDPVSRSVAEVAVRRWGNPSWKGLIGREDLGA